MYIYFYFMNHKSVIVNFPKNSLKIESILAHVILFSLNIQMQCDVRGGVLSTDVFFF